MATAPLLGGMIAGPTAEFIASPPINLEPVVFDGDNGVSEGQLRATAGASTFATGPGLDRGGILWNDTHYRVMGTKLVSVSSSGLVTVLGDVGGSGPVSLDYDFTRLAIRSGTTLWYWNGTALTQVTDPDLGPVKDMLWVDGYFMTTDGNSIVVTQLNDPTAVDPLKYGSAEQDPDMITGLIKFREEIYALGRHTVQVFQNAGKTGFPFTQVEGATIPYGCVSSTAKCLFAESFAFVGSARGEALGVYVATDGSAVKISSKALDEALALEADPTAIALESRTYGDERRLLVHLEKVTWVYYWKASKRGGSSIWGQLSTNGAYRLRNAVVTGKQIIVGDTQSAQLGLLDERIQTHFGTVAEWRFDTVYVYNQSAGAILHEAELIGLPGSAPFGALSVAFISATHDGQTWGQERPCPMGVAGQRAKRIRWRPHWRMRKILGLRFRGFGAAVASFASLEIEAEPLAV